MWAFDEIFWICIIIASELCIFRISNLASEVKFDHVSQSSFWSKVAYLTKGLCRKEIVLISIIVSELWPFEIFNLTLGGQSTFRSKKAYLTKGLYRKEIVLISIIASELWPFKIFNLVSEVKFDLGGQSSFWPKVAY